MELIKQLWTSICDVFTGGVTFNIITFFGMIIGFTLAIIFYRKSKRLLLVTYAVRTIELIKGSAENLKLLKIIYNDKIVPTLSISKIALWNGGRDTINQSSFANLSPLKIKLDDKYDILEASVLYMKNSSNDFKITVGENLKYIDIEFDYFDKNEGLILQIYHTGKNSDNIKVEGRIKSGKNPNRISYLSSQSLLNVLNLNISVLFSKNITNIINRYNRIKIFGWILLLFSIIILIIGIYDIWFKDATGRIEVNPITETIIIIILAFFYGAIGYKGLMKQTPKGFNIFNEEFNSESSTEVTTNNEKSNK